MITCHPSQKIFVNVLIELWFGARQGTKGKVFLWKDKQIMLIFTCFDKSVQMAEID